MDGSSSSCNTCLSWDGTQQRNCQYWKGIRSAAAFVTDYYDGNDGNVAVVQASSRSTSNSAFVLSRPPSPGYNNPKCAVGYEQFNNLQNITIGCPQDTVLYLEVMPFDNSNSNNGNSVTIQLAQQLNVQLPATEQPAPYYYDFQIETPSDDILIEFEPNQCLTGTGGRGCGEDPLVMLAYHQKGQCNTTFASGMGYQVNCQKQFTQQKERDCPSKTSGLTCQELNMLKNTGDSVNPNNTSSDSYSRLCGIDEWESFGHSISSWLVGVAVFICTLIPTLSQLLLPGGINHLTRCFWAGILSEATKNGAVAVSLMSVDWSCLSQGDSNPTALLPYALMTFSLTDTILLILAMIFRYMQTKPIEKEEQQQQQQQPIDASETESPSAEAIVEVEGEDGISSAEEPAVLTQNSSTSAIIREEETLNNFKWSRNSNSLALRIGTFMIIALLGGLGGFLQLALILEGVVDSPEQSAVGESALSEWASWIFVCSAALGGFLGFLLVLCGVYTKNMWLAWTIYKIMVGDIPGTVSAVDLAVVLSPGWLAEFINDILQLALYLPGLLPEIKEESSRRNSGRREKASPERASVVN